MSITVTKADGSREPFKVNKLRASLKKAGASNDEIKEVIKQTDAHLHDGITTQEIYRLAFDFLRGSEAPTRARYSLRRALFGLGPTGFPFEDFLARLFAYEGYTTRTRVILHGHCADHELDVAAYSETDSFVAEAKFHSHPGIKSDLQVVLYSFARLHDLRDTKICQADVCGITELMVVTNTKFTSSAERYAHCAGLTLLSWEHPKGNNLHDRIERAHMYPITVLQSLSPSQKRALIEQGIIVCNDLTKRPHVLRRVHISQRRMEQVLHEAQCLSEEDLK